MRSSTTMCVCLCALFVACAPPVKRIGAAPTAAQMAALWIDPGSTPRNLFNGPGGNTVPRPASDARYDVIERDTAGFSITYRVRDESGREWNVKVGPEAQTEVVASRIVWALGYHQLPSYFVERWIAVDKAKGSMLGGARFRPHELGLKSAGEWSWQQNPLVGSLPYNGLLVLMMILNSTDLKNQNNTLYEVIGEPRENATQWYVVKDLGATLGETGRMDPRRGYIDGFERERFIVGVDDGRVRFGFRGRHQELLANITVEDVRWACDRLRKVSDRQWADAFRAGNFSEDLTRRYVTRIQQKITQGLELK